MKRIVKSILITTILTVVSISAILYILIPKSCDSFNFGWGIHKECICLGIKISDSEDDARIIPDLGYTNSCIGIVLKRNVVVW